MLDKFKIFIFSLLLFLAVAGPAFSQTAVEKFNSSLEATGGGGGYTTGTIASRTIPQTIGLVIKIFLNLLGVIFFVLMIYGGFRWMLARGDESEVETAKDIIQNAAIGLIIVLAAYAITFFIGNIIK